jgi:hypothetical protein
VSGQQPSHQVLTTRRVPPPIVGENQQSRLRRTVGLGQGASPGTAAMSKRFFLAVEQHC